jgi:hypothetical protein
LLSPRSGLKIAAVDWIRRGLRFECQPECGKCCSNEREGSVFLEAEDVARLAAHLSIPPARFVREYTSVPEGGDRELAKSPDGGCVFLVERRCTVQAAKPLQCRAYPFLPLDGYTPIESPYTWRHEKGFCPGIGKGRFYRKGEIADIARGRGAVGGFEV